MLDTCKKGGLAGCYLLSIGPRQRQCCHRRTHLFSQGLDMRLGRVVCRLRLLVVLFRINVAGAHSLGPVKTEPREFQICICFGHLGIAHGQIGHRLADLFARLGFLELKVVFCQRHVRR
jgi:hypothetical protein